MVRVKGWSRVMTAALLALGGALTGCAVSLPLDGPALVVGYVSTGPGTGISRRVVPGIDLDLSTDTPGLRLGWSDVTVATPADPAAFPAAGDGGPAFAPPLGLRWRGADGRDHSLGLLVVQRPAAPRDQPLFIAQSCAGLALEVAPGRSGLGLGFARQASLTCPPLDAAFVLVHTGGRTCFLRLDLEDLDGN
jgi:hypothetical protein